MAKQTTKPSANIDQARSVAADGTVVLEHKLPSGSVFIAETRKGLQQICVLPDGGTFFADRLLAKLKFGATAPTFVGYVATDAPVVVQDELDQPDVVVDIPVVSSLVVPESSQSSEPVVTTPDTSMEAVVGDQQVDIVVNTPVIVTQDVQLIVPEAIMPSVTGNASDTHEEDYLFLVGECSPMVVLPVVDEAPSFVDFYEEKNEDNSVSGVTATQTTVCSEVAQQEQQAVLEETPTVVVDSDVVTDVVIKSETIIVPEETKVSEDTSVKSEEEEMEALLSKGMSALTVEEKKKVIHYKMGRPMEKFLADLSAKHPPYKTPAKSETTKPAKKGWFW